MKFRNFIIVLLAVLMAFAFASCKHEPDDPKPAPKPITGDIYQIEVTEGADVDYYNRDKIKLFWNLPIQEGDTLSLKYRSERDIYQWDIRNDSHKWVYETKKNGFEDPVLGEDGWYTLEYTFGKTIDGTAGASSAFGVYFRGNFVSTDILEIKEILLNGEELEVEASNIISQAKLNDPAEEFDWSVKNWAVLFAIGKPGEVDKTPIVEKVVDGGFVTGAPIAKDGFTLTIYTDEAHSDIFDPTIPITEEKIFYYEYVGVPRTVTFVTNSDSVIAPVQVPNSDSLAYAHQYDEAGHYAVYTEGEQAGEKIIVSLVPANPEKADLVFAAWCSDEGLTTDFDLATAITADTTLYAKYGTPRTVTFDAQNGEAEHAKQVVADGYKATMPEAPTNGSKMFLGWYTDAECTAVFDFGTAITADTILYAGWVNATDVTLNLNYEGAPAATSFKAALDVALEADNENLAVEKRIGFFFEGWYTDAECTTAYDYATIVTAPFTLYAKWRAGNIAQLTSTFNYADDHGNFDKFRVKFTDGDYAKVVQEDDVLTFRYRTTTPITKFNVRGSKKWIYQRDFAVPNLTSIETGADGWTSVVYTFPKNGTSFDDGGGTIDYTNNYTFYFDFISYTIEKGDIIEIQGMALNGVELTIDGGNTQSGSSSTKPTYKAIAADYSWANHNVTFDYGDSVTKSVSVDFNKTVTAPTDTAKEGLAFIGWYTDAELTTPFDLSTRIVADVTVYGKWIEAWTVTVNPNNGGEAKTVYAGKGVAVDASDLRVGKAGYFLEGWYTDAELTQAWNLADAVTANMSLYAKWAAPTESYKYTIKAGGETDDRAQWIWTSANLAALANVKEGDVFTFMLKTTPDTGMAITNFRLRNGAETDIGFKYIDLPAAGADGWIAATIVMQQDSGAGFVFGLYAAGHPAASILPGDVLEIKAVALNGAAITVGNLDTGYSTAADMEVIDLTL